MRAEREARQRSRAYAVRQEVHTTRVRRRRRDDVVALVVLVVVIALATTAQVGFFTLGPGRPAAKSTAGATPTPTPSPTATATVPAKSLAKNTVWTETMTIGGAKLTLRLDGRKAPQAVANFLALTRNGFYDDAYCPRLTTKALFVLQCGTTTPSPSDAGPGYTFGPLENVPASTVTRNGVRYGVYKKGVLAMARGSAEDSQAAQFFIVYRDTELPVPGYTVFGTVTKGLASLRSKVVAAGVEASAKAAGDGAPARAVRITAAKVAD